MEVWAEYPVGSDGADLGILQKSNYFYCSAGAFLVQAEYFNQLTLWTR